MSYRIISYRIIIMSYHIMSYHVISYIVSYHVIRTSIYTSHHIKDGWVGTCCHNKRSVGDVTESQFDGYVQCIRVVPIHVPMLYMYVMYVYPSTSNRLFDAV